MKSTSPIFGSLLAAALAVACYTAPDGGGATPGGGSAPSGCTASITSIQQTIFAVKCATSGCHTAADRAGGLDLASPGVEARLVGFPSTCKGKLLVAPGDAEDSMIVDKLVNAQPACGGARMPLGGTLDDGDTACITQWIASLAPGDGGSDRGEAGTP